MLVYHHAFDLYNCIFRMLQLITHSKEIEIHVDKLRIWDFYLTFPSEVRNITFPADLRKLKEQVFKDKDNPYENLTDPKRIFERMKSYQLTAIKCLVSYGFIDSKLLPKNLVKRTEKEIPDQLKGELSSLTPEKINIIKLVTSDLVTLPLFGDKGWKARSGLIDFKYDPR